MDKENITKTEKLKEIISSAHRVVFFGGAGVSTESGIPDFRGTKGLYVENNNSYDKPAEYLLSNTCLMREPELFFDYYRNAMLYPGAKPNKAHKALAQLEAEGKLTAVVTQNIDGLHQLAGSKTVFELHGSVKRNYCLRCREKYPPDHILNTKGVPICSKCGGVIRPDVVLYGEGLDNSTFINAELHIERADVLIVGGTSLVVQPAASLITAYRGSKLIIINYTPTPYDRYAEHVIRDSVGDVLNKICK